NETKSRQKDIVLQALFRLTWSRFEPGYQAATEFSETLIHGVDLDLNFFKDGEVLQWLNRK
ncbi:MAG: hypothetical protein ABTR20_03460, partial [Candidatus Competibacter sp.]